MSVLRQRKKSRFYGADFVRELDTFPKTKNTTEDHFDSTWIGGFVSLIAFSTIAWILLSEIQTYFESHLTFKFKPDTNFDDKLKLNIDLTVAMPCHSVGTDVLDSTEQNLFAFGSLEEEDTWFALSPEQEQSFREKRHLNAYLREEFHAIHELLWKSGQSFLNNALPKRREIPSTVPDACRIYGTLVLNKVAGNLHITAGKPLHLPGGGGHVHISAFNRPSSYNFSHRIQHFSFGEASSGIIHPLHGDEKITQKSNTLHQYFIEVVGTDVETLMSTVSTYQYSVKSNERYIDHDKGSHGVPGIFFKYSMSSLRVQVKQAHESLLSFLIRLSSTLAGVYISAGLLRDLLQGVYKRVLKFQRNKAQDYTKFVTGVSVIDYN